MTLKKKKMYQYIAGTAVTNPAPTSRVGASLGDHISHFRRICTSIGDDSVSSAIDQQPRRDSRAKTRTSSVQSSINQARQSATLYNVPSTIVAPYGAGNQRAHI